MVGGFVLALPANATVKLRPGNVFEALQSCCLVFYNVFLAWPALGLQDRLGVSCVQGHASQP